MSARSSVGLAAWLRRCAWRLSVAASVIVALGGLISIVHPMYYNVAHVWPTRLIIVGVCVENAFLRLEFAASTDEIKPFSSQYSCFLGELAQFVSRDIVIQTANGSLRFGCLYNVHVTFPSWLPALGMLLVHWVRSMLRGRRASVARAGRECVRCGYSLFALTSDRCPECGEIVEVEDAGSH